MSEEHCALCGCHLRRGGDAYAKPTPEGRAHATKHHYVAERFFGRSANRPGTRRAPIFTADPWKTEGQTGVFCYECHEQVLHNPVFLPADVERLAQLVRRRRLSEETKNETRHRVAGRIALLHEAIDVGLRALLRPSAYPRVMSR